jgi:hypothetical protein
VPDVRSKPGFAQVFEHNHEEVAVLHSFVNLKERQLDRQTKLHASQGQVQAYQAVIVETKEFIEYLQSFPNTIKTFVHASTEFWWSILQRTEEYERGTQVPMNENEMNSIVSLFPTMKRRGYFGPRREAPGKKEPLQTASKRKKDGPLRGTTSASQQRPRLKEPLSNAVPLQQQRWFDFDPHMDVHIGDFVGVQALESTQQNGELFWVAKVRELRNVAREDGGFLALWYWPTSPKGLRDGPNAMRTQYANCLARTWEPDRMYRRNDWIVVNSLFVSWTHSRKLKSDLVTVQGFRTEKKISIPTEQHPHFQNHLSLLHVTGLEDALVE